MPAKKLRLSEWNSIDSGERGSLGKVFKISELLKEQSESFVEGRKVLEGAEEQPTKEHSGHLDRFALGPIRDDGNDPPPLWVKELGVKIESIKRLQSLQDAKWWNRLSSGNFASEKDFEVVILSIEECLQLSSSNDLLLLKSKPSSAPASVWVNTKWLLEQYQVGRPLRLIHKSFLNIPITKVIPHLIDLFKTFECRIHLYNPLKVKEGELIAQQFTISFE